MKIKKKKTKGGLFMTVEGPEGSGKSTHIKHMARWLKRRGYRVRILREPGGTKLGESVRALLLDSRARIARHAELFLFLAARAQLVAEVILPALKRGEIVLCDRYFDSTIVYQGIASGLGRDFVARLCAWGAQGLVPDFTIFLDVHHRTGLKRAGRKDRMEKKGLDFHARVAEGYRLLARQPSRRSVLINANQPLSTVTRHVEEALRVFFE